MSNLTNMVETINKLKFLTDVVSNDLVRQQFINVYNAVWKQGGEQVYEREANYFNKILRENSNLNGCKLSGITLRNVSAVITYSVVYPA